MENHREKLAIFDQYFENTGEFTDFHDFILSYFSGELNFREFENHIGNATDLVQQEALKRASENVDFVYEKVNGSLMDTSFEIDKQSILNDENLVK